MNYGSVLDANYAKFSDDEKLNYGLKIALSRLQTELNRAWYQEPKDFAPKGPETIYKNKLPSYTDLENYFLIDPFCTVNGSANTSVITNVTVGDILNNSSNASGWGFGDTNGSKDFYDVNTSGNQSVRNNSTNITNTSIAQQGLSYRMFTRYRYWENGLTGKNSNTDGTAGSSSGGTNTNKTEPENAILSYVGNNLSSTRTWKAYDDNLGKGNSEDQFFTKLTTYSSPIKIIHPDNINTNDYTDITKAHPFLEIYIQVPTVSTRQSADTANTSGSGNNANGTDNIGFFNPILRQSLGDVEGYKYVIRGWAGSIAKWGDLTIESGATNNTNILYFLNNPGFILCYGVKDIVNGLNLSYKYPPLISFLRYTGETFSDGIISQGDTLPAVEVSNDKDLFINTTDNTIHRLEDNNGTKTWVGIGGGGGGGDGDMEINGVLKIKNDSTTTPENSFSIVNANDDYRFLTTLVGGSSHLYMYNAAGNIPITLSTDWHSYFNVTGGNVGIGTDFSDMSGDYGAKLTIGDYDNNYSKVSEKVYDTLRLSVKTDKSTSYHGLHWYDIQNSYMMSAIRSSVGANWNNSSLHFYTSKDRNTPTQKMSIDGDGNVNISPGNLTTTGNTIITGSVGIGTNTINDYTKLHVYGGSYISNGYFKVNDDNGNDMFWIMNGKSFFKSTIKIDHGVKIGRDTLMDPDTSGNIVCKFSNGSNSNAYLRAYYSSTKYLTLGAYSSYNFMLSTGSPLKLGGDGGYKMTLNSSGATIEGNLTVSGTVTANGETLTGGGGQHLLIDGHKWATTADYASLSYKTLNQETNGTYGLLLDSAGSTYINAYSNNHIYFLNNDVQIGVFSSSGKFGIGNIATSTMSSELEVHGSAYVSNNVGIGTNVPVAPLSICGSSSNFNESNVRGIHMGIISGNNQAAIEINGYNHAFIDFKLESGGGGNTDRHARIEYYNRKLYFETEATDRMIIDSNGRVGIGSDAPNASLDVNGSTHLDYMETSSWIYIKGATGRWPLPSTSGYRWSKTWSRTGATWVDSFPIALRIDSGSIYSQNDPVLHTNSDIRIKKDIEEVPDNLSLEMVRNIPCKYYKYIDEGRNIKNNDKKVIGFIAQEVKEVFPLAVDLVNDFEPNENRLLENISWEKITDNSNNVCKYKLTSDLQDVSGVKYKFYMVNDPSGNVPETKKEVIGNNDNTFTFDNSWNYVFCVGREINDFHALDKSKLFTLNFSATQEIDRIQQKQLLDISGNKVEIELLKLENQDLKDEIKIIKQENKALLSKLEAFEKRLENANI